MAALAALTAGCENDSEAPLGAAEVGVTVERTTGNSVTVIFEPDFSTARYDYAIGAAADEGAFAAGTLEGVVAVSTNDIKTVEFGGLAPDTPYAVFVRAEDEAGTPGRVKSLKVRTAEAAAEVRIEVLDVSDGSATVSVVPNGHTSSYEFAMGRADDMRAFLDGTLGGAVSVTGNEAVEYTFGNLPPESEFTVFARGYTAAGIPGEAVAETLETPSYPWAYIEVTEHNAMYMNAAISFSSVVTGANWWCGPRSEFDALCGQLGGPEAVAALFQPRQPGDYELNYMRTNGDSAPKGDDFIFLAAFWTGNGAYYGYRVYEIPAYEYDPSLPVPGGFKYSLVEKTEDMIHVRVEFEESTASVYSMPMTRAQYERMSTGEIMQYLFAPLHWGTSSKACYKEWIMQGMEVWEGDKFIVAAVGCNANGALGASDVYYAEFDL